MGDIKYGWWKEPEGFFGENYILGDNSIEGYLPGKKESLEERTKREVEGLLNVLNVKSHHIWGPILDCPCGYGRHSIALAAKGYEVHGVDINETHLRKAESDAKRILGEDKVGIFGKIRFYEKDMRKINELFDAFAYNYGAIINMFFSFGFFDDYNNKEVMERFYDALTYDNGRLLIHTDVSTEMIKSGNYRLNEERKLVSGKKLIIAENYDSSTKRLNGSWSICDDNNGTPSNKSDYSMRIYSKEEYVEMAKEVGFREVKIYGSFDKEEFTPASHELIMVATKY